MFKKVLISWFVLITLPFVIFSSCCLAEGENAESIPIAPVRPLYPDTWLVRGGEVTATIVYPSKVDGYRKLAERISAAVKTKTGVDLPILPDTEVTERKHPVLLDEFRDRDLILLGRLGINRAMWGVYNRFLCAVDGYYPGGDGHVVRTASNVYDTGKNSIIVGGSTDQGAATAVDTLIELIDTQSATDGNLVLPWLLDVELGGECEQVVDADEKRQMARDVDAQGHANNPYRRFYENVMSYYWTGRKSYLKLALVHLDKVLKNYKSMPPEKRKLASHYSGEFFVRAYDMIDDSGVLSPELIRTIDQGLLDTSYNCCGHGPREPLYRHGLRKRLDEGRYDEIHTSDHANASWLADKTLADFILGKIPETPEMAVIFKEARERQKMYVELFDALVSDRWRGCKVAQASTTVPAMTFFRHALEMERYDEFFDSGNARRSALYHLGRVSSLGRDIGMQNGGLFGWTEYGLLLGIAASYYQDGELRAILDDKPGRKDGHYGCYILGIHAYKPGDELPATKPKSLIGVSMIPVQPVHYRRMKTGFRGTPDTSEPYERTFDLATIRGGFKSDDDYLLLYGGHGGRDDLPPNAIVKLNIDEQAWLTHTASTKHFNQNALFVARLSDLDLKNLPVPPAARLERLGNSTSAALVSSTMADYAGTDWNRRIVWLPGNYFIVIDEVTARKPGDYLVMANWRPNLYGFDKSQFNGFGPVRRGSLKGDRWIVPGKEREFVMACVGSQGIQLVEDLDVEPVSRVSTPVFRQRLTAPLKKDERVSVTNVMFTRPSGSKKDVELRTARNGGLLIRSNENPEDIVYVGPFPFALGESDAQTVVLTPKKLIAFDAGNLIIGNLVLAENGPVETREIAFTDDRSRTVLDTLWKSGVSSKPRDSGVEADDVASLALAWRYDGARQPGLVIDAKQVGENLWDLGSVVDLSKIAAMTTGELSWEERSNGTRLSGKLPKTMLTSVAGKDGTFDPFEGEVTDVDVPVMVNYGRVEKNEAVFQIVEATPRKARFVKVVADPPLAAKALRFYDAAKSDERQDPLRTSVIRSKDEPTPNILVYPDIWSGFRRVTRLDHEIVALNAEGEEQWRKRFDWRIFFVRLLDWNGDGADEIFVGSLDNAIRVYDADGQRIATLSDEGLYSYGEGGYPLAINAGLWLPDETGRSEIVTSRYCYLSFLDRNGKLKGHIRPGIYWITDLLDQGIDVTGDGLEDQLAMTSSQIFFLDSTSTTRACQPRFPPIWRDENAGSTIDPLCGTVNLPSGHSSSLSGSPTLGFNSFGKEKTKLFVARKNMIAVLDLKTRGWTMSWTPEIPIAAAIALPESHQILCATGDGILWRIKLDDNLTVATVETTPVPMKFNRFAVLNRKAGIVVGASNQGLFKINPDNSLDSLVPGAFRDVIVYPSDENLEKLVAVDENNVVEAYYGSR